MKGKDTFRLCRKCGKPIAVISVKVYKSVLVDADPVWIIAEEPGEKFVSHDGKWIRGREADLKKIEDLLAEPAYRPHRCGE